MDTIHDDRYIRPTFEESMSLDVSPARSLAERLEATGLSYPREVLTFGPDARASARVGDDYWHRLAYFRVGRSVTGEILEPYLKRTGCVHAHPLALVALAERLGELPEKPPYGTKRHIVALGASIRPDSDEHHYCLVLSIGGTEKPGFSLSSGRTGWDDMWFLVEEYPD